ncbi:AAA family ATPase [Pseudonocardia eucalypti]|uniref:AAA family ATPase n=1 Tax=Pseudonocardia eucalypti TaxID=648755 RepID=A0ABP9R6B2_9PSEU|nr:hypothetical protein [Pseudonocardia eucalypti]
MASLLIGREHPVGVLHRDVARVLDGQGGLALVAGEAGIGKTTLVTEVAAEARRRGARVLNGACWDGEGAPDYWPWVQVARNLARAASTAEWSAAAEAAGDGLPALLGDSGPAPGPTATDSSAFRLHDAITNLLVTAARGQPLVIVLEDLHWADPASVRLLDFVVRHAWLEPILVVGTYRDVELDAPEHPLRPLMAPLLPRATTVRLGGLDADAVGELIARATGAPPDTELVAEVHRRTGGNPFFVEQTAQLSGPLSGAGVRDAIERRLAPLPEPATRLLSVASVIGQEFDPTLLGAAAEVPAAEVDRLLAPAEVARLITRQRSGRPRFVHDLVREFLYGSLSDEARRGGHAAVVRALCAPDAPTADPTIGSRAATLAHHARLAIPVLAESEAVELLLAAAYEAYRRLAHEESLRHYRAAQSLLSPDRRGQRLAVNLDVAFALDRAGELEPARAAFGEVIAEARELGEAKLQAWAMLGLHRLGNASADPREELDLIDEARERLAASGENEPALAAQLLAAASMSRAHQVVEAERAAELGEQAVELARREADAETLGWCLLALHDAMWEPGTARRRLDVLAEMTAVAHRAHDRELESLASWLRSLALLELGDPAAHTEFAAFIALTERTRLPRHRFLAVSRAGTMLSLAGRFDEAHERCDAGLAFGEQVGETDRVRVWRDQIWSLELLRGDPEAAARALDATPGDRYTELLAALLPDGVPAPGEAAGRLTAAEPLFERLPGRFRSIRHALLAQLALGGDAELGRLARDVLTPLADQWAVVSGGIILGPVSYWLGQVDAALGDPATAVRRFRYAGEAADRLGARPYSVLARAALARSLRVLGEAGEAEAAWTSAHREAEELGMTGALAPFAPRPASLEEAREEAPGAPERPEPPEPAAAAPGQVFRFDGPVWTLRYAGRTVHAPDAKGLRDLHTLLGRPGVEIPAAQLLNPTGEPEVARTQHLGADPMLDEQARAAYKKRLLRIDEDIQDALDRGDDRRAGALDREREALLAELREATGLGGRARRLGDSGERARQAVTARIRDSIRRLRKLHPELAEHLAGAVSTGAHCRYQPAEPTRWTR